MWMGRWWWSWWNGIGEDVSICGAPSSCIFLLFLATALSFCFWVCCSSRGSIRTGRGGSQLVPSCTRLRSYFAIFLLAMPSAVDVIFAGLFVGLHFFFSSTFRLYLLLWSFVNLILMHFCLHLSLVVQIKMGEALNVASQVYRSCYDMFLTLEGMSWSTIFTHV